MRVALWSAALATALGGCQTANGSAETDEPGSTSSSGESASTGVGGEAESSGPSGEDTGESDLPAAEYPYDDDPTLNPFSLRAFAIDASETSLGEEPVDVLFGSDQTIGVPVSPTTLVVLVPDVAAGEYTVEIPDVGFRVRAVVGEPESVSDPRERIGAWLDSVETGLDELETDSGFTGESELEDARESLAQARASIADLTIEDAQRTWRLLQSLGSPSMSRGVRRVGAALITGGRATSSEHACREATENRLVSDATDVVVGAALTYAGFVLSEGGLVKIGAIVGGVSLAWGLRSAYVAVPAFLEWAVVCISSSVGIDPLASDRARENASLRLASGGVAPAQRAATTVPTVQRSVYKVDAPVQQAELGPMESGVAVFLPATLERDVLYPPFGALLADVQAGVSAFEGLISGVDRLLQLPTEDSSRAAGPTVALTVLEPAPSDLAVELQLGEGELELLLTAPVDWAVSAPVSFDIQSVDDLGLAGRSTVTAELSPQADCGALGESCCAVSPACEEFLVCQAGACVDLGLAGVVFSNAFDPSMTTITNAQGEPIEVGFAPNATPWPPGDYLVDAIVSYPFGGNCELQAGDHVVQTVTIPDCGQGYFVGPEGGCDATLGVGINNEGCETTCYCP